MAVESDEPITEEEKIRISSDFILHSPPGEFNEVFNDIRVLVCNDMLVKEGAFCAIAQHNKNQLTPVKIDGSNFAALITDFNDLGGYKFFDPRSQQSFKYDHLRKEAFEFKAWKPDADSEKWRKAVQDECTTYTSDHYTHGTCSVFGTNVDGVITITACIEDHQFQPKNFWNGQWRSIWSMSFKPGATTAEVSGTLKVQVHYYEDGNVQLVTSKEVKESFKVSTELQTAIEFLKVIEEVESEYQLALHEGYEMMSYTTFKALRRLLPVTRMKINWNQILSYSVGTELKRCFV